MRHILLGLVVVAGHLSCCVPDGFAQQRQLRPVTVTYRGSSIKRTQWSPDSSASNPTPSTAANTSDTAVPGLLPGSPQQSVQSSSAATPGSNTNPQSDDLSQRPTIQQLQNPSGGFNLTHSNFSTGQYTSANNYFGNQYNDWSNLRTQPANLSLFESFNRYQPSSNSGAYFSPNTYVGPANTQWNNLSSGTISSNYLGSWIYQP